MGQRSSRQSASPVGKTPKIWPQPSCSVQVNFKMGLKPTCTQESQSFSGSFNITGLRFFWETDKTETEQAAANDLKFINVQEKYVLCAQAIKSIIILDFTLLFQMLFPETKRSSKAITMTHQIQGLCLYCLTHCRWLGLVAQLDGKDGCDLWKDPHIPTARGASHVNLPRWVHKTNFN